MSLLTVIIPTWNRDYFLDQSLAALSEYFDTFDLEVLICNNASTDNTAQVIQKWTLKYSQIRVITQPKHCIYDENVAAGYFHATSDYLWVLGDCYVIPKGTMSLIINTLSRNHPDALILNANNCINIPDKVYNSANEIMNDCGWFLTLLCSCIISNKFINEDRIKRYTGTAFIHLGIFFDFISYKTNNQIIWLKQAALHYKQPNTTSRKSWRSIPFETFGRGWFAFIMSLPFQIPIETKLKCIAEHDFHRNIFSMKAILWGKLSGRIDFSDYKESRMYMQWVTKTPLWLLDIISLCPKLPGFFVEFIMKKKVHS